jgi:hypothetical protein
MRSQKSYKSPSKANKKKKKIIVESETGMLAKVNASNRNPIICLPEIVTNPILTVYRRFVANGAVSGTIQISDLHNQFCTAVTSTAGFPIHRMIRLKKIRCLSPVTSQGTSVTLTMLPNTVDTGQNNFNAVPELYLDTSASIDIPAYLSLTPSLQTPLGSWHSSNTSVNSNLMQLVCPSGSTLDILFELILRSDIPNAGSSYQRTIAAAIIGVQYAAPILTNLQPAGVNAI